MRTGLHPTPPSLEEESSMPTKSTQNSVASPYREVRAHTWPAARALLDDLKGSWVFRGQSNADHTLSTSLERRMLSKVSPTLNPAELLAVERLLTSRFMWGARLYYGAGQAPTNTLGWWAEMQHYGMPTRLLDFSWSPYVASFFAAQNAAQDTDCAIWALHIETHLTHVLDYPPSVTEFILSEFGDEVDRAALDAGRFWEDPVLVDRFIERAQLKGLRALITLASERMNQRIMAQQGVFVMPSCLDIGFMGCLEQSPEGFNKESLVKIVLPGSERNEALDDLARMNITYVSLFPGLDGFVRTLSDRIERILSEYPEYFKANLEGRGYKR